MRGIARRRYKSGTRWGFWLWTDVRLEGQTYLTRLHLLKAPGFSIFLHWILKPDSQRDLHDHPVPFLSLILRGWYGEVQPDGYHLRRWFNWITPTTRHRITRTSAGGVLTLCIAGPPRTDRPWGFHTPEGFVPWTEYDHVGETTGSAE